MFFCSIHFYLFCCHIFIFFFIVEVHKRHKHKSKECHHCIKYCNKNTILHEYKNLLFTTIELPSYTSSSFRMTHNIVAVKIMACFGNICLWFIFGYGNVHVRCWIWNKGKTKINCDINNYYQPSSIDSIWRHVKCKPSKSSYTSAVDQRAVDCKSSPTGSVLGSAHNVILWEILIGVDQFQDLAGKGLNMQSNQGFSQKCVQLSYGCPFLEEIQGKFT